MWCCPIKLVLLLVLSLVFTVHGEYKKLEWSDCGSKGGELLQADIFPMPMVLPGAEVVTLVARFFRMVTILETKLTITRTVSGITLPIKCYITNGQQVGSCTYPDLCLLLKGLLPGQFTPQTCPQMLLDIGSNCDCPLNIPPNKLEILNLSVNLPDPSTIPGASFLTSGDIRVKIEAFDRHTGAPQPYGCANLGFTIKNVKPSG